MLRKFLSKLFFFLGLAGCSSFSSMEVASRLEYPIDKIRWAITQTFPKEVQLTNKGDREFKSGYFLISKRRMVPALRASKKYYAKILILGDRRPYSLAVQVKKVKRVKKSSKSVEDVELGHSKRLARAIKKRIQKILTKGRKDFNIIDDFRVF